MLSNGVSPCWDIISVSIVLRAVRLIWKPVMIRVLKAICRNGGDILYWSDQKPRSFI